LVAVQGKVRRRLL